MPARLFACPACARHICVDEPRCPFCGVTCPESFAAAPAPVPPPQGLSRAELVRFGARAAVGGVALAAAVGCSSNNSSYGLPYGAPPQCGPSTYACPEASTDAESDAAGDGGTDTGPDAPPPSDAGDGG